MATVNSLDKARKKQSKLTIAKRVFLSVTVVIVVFFTYLQRIEIANMGFAIWLEGRLSDYMSTNKFPVEIPKGSEKQLVAIGPRIGVVQSSGVSIYSGAGEWIRDIRTSYKNPISVSNSRRLVTYDLGSYSLRQDMGEDMIYERTYSYPITFVALSEGHKMAVTTGESRFLSKVEVYSKDFSEIFSWSSAETNVTATSLTDHHLATAGAAAKGGMLYSDITWLSLKSNEPKCVVKIEDELVFYLKFINDDQLLALTNKSAVLINKSGQIQSKVVLGHNLGAFLVDKAGNLCVVLGNYTATHRAEIIKYDSSLQEIARMPVDFQIKRLLEYGDNIVAFAGDYANVYNNKMELVNTVATPDAITAVMNNKYLYYATQSSLNRRVLFDTNK